MRFHCIVVFSAALAFALPASAARVLGFRTDFETGLFSGFSGEARVAPLAKVNGSAGAKLGVLLHNDTGGAKTKATTITLKNLSAHESIDIDFLLAVIGKWAVDRVAEGMAPQAAAEAAIERLGKRLGAHGGLILLDRRGRPAVAFNAERMAWGMRSELETRAGVGRALDGQITGARTD